MTSIRLLSRFVCHHHELSVGEVISVRGDLARFFCSVGIAEPVEPLRAVVEPQETRVQRPINRKGR